MFFKGIIVTFTYVLLIKSRYYNLESSYRGHNFGATYNELTSCSR